MENNWEALIEDTSGNHPEGEDVAVFGNTLYLVVVRQYDEDLVHLSIKRNDQKPIRNWRHFQYIKNQICGEESFGFEVYPPESVLVDLANQYHIWVCHKDNLPEFCFNTRLVSECNMFGSNQSPWEENMKPNDLLTSEQLKDQAAKYFDEIKKGDD